MSADIWIKCPSCGTRVPSVAELCPNGCCWACHETQACEAVPCPWCSVPTPTAVMCEHDDPCCRECCLQRHPNRCPDCEGRRALTLGKDRWGYPITETCGTCEGRGRINEGNVA